MQPRVVQTNHPSEYVSLGIRKYLVILRYAHHVLHFSVLSDEATSPDAAVEIALKRVGCGQIGPNERLGDLITAPVVVTDSEDARDKAGITDEGYPASYGIVNLSWYDSPLDVAHGRCRLCGVPVSRERRRMRTGKFYYCDLHAANEKGAAA